MAGTPPREKCPNFTSTSKPSDVRTRYHIASRGTAQAGTTNIFTLSRSSANVLQCLVFIFKVISVLPEAATEEAEVKVVESTEDVDPVTKIEILRKEQATIKAERKAEKQRVAEEKKKKKEEEAAAAKPESEEPAAVDKAPVQTQSPAEECKS